VTTIAPYGSWRSPITPESLVTAAVRLSQVTVDGVQVIWNEGRPSESGRQVLVRASPDGEIRDLIPAGFSARTLVHEYGGRSYAAAKGVLVFSDFADQRLWYSTPGREPKPLTAEPKQPRAVRFADPVLSPDGAWLICVRERHGDDVVNDLVAVPLPSPGDEPAGDAEPVVLAAGHDFYSFGRLSPDGSRLAWVSWDHPSMPWDHTELWVADLRGGRTHGARRLAGRDESISQPRWSPAGRLHYISDRSGWWNLYDEDGINLAPSNAEFCEPDWVFGQSSYVFLDDGRLVAVWSGEGGQQLGLIIDGSARPIDVPFTSFGSLQSSDGAVVATAGSPTTAAAVVRIGVDDAHVTVLRRSRDEDMDAAWVSVPRAVTFPTSGAREAHALHYPPTNPDFSAPEGERPPLIVMSHGGPTSATTSVLNPEVQFWTSRGFAVADVDYGGSSGYGRSYRQQLRDAWGIVDVDDCVAGADWLASAGEVDPARMVIRGGSAGGYTTLAALTFRDTFAGGASHFGVADLALLARHTHKFESRYLDGLVGPWPEADAVYRERSPIHHVELVSRPLILFQGLEDEVVPPEQAELMADALRARGVPVAYLAFEGEQHGFRKADTIIRVAGAELAFYGRVLGFAPAGGIEPLVIDNEHALAAQSPAGA
jgi:dipeptidyl aminopeptidase/acylaminoacyl peptidase